MSNNETGKVLFKDIVRTCAFRNVKESLLRLYPDQKRAINGISMFSNSETYEAQIR